MIKDVLDKVKKIVRSIYSNIKKVLQILASINTTTNLGFLIGGVDSKISQILIWCRKR